MLKVIDLSINILRNVPINHIESSLILLDSKEVDFSFCYLDNKNNVCLLNTTVISNKDDNGNYRYSISKEEYFEKPLSSVRLKRDLTDFSSLSPKLTREKEKYLLDDVSFVVALNKNNNNDTIRISSLLSFLDCNDLAKVGSMPSEVISFLDPSIETIKFLNSNDKRFILLKFKGKHEIVLNRFSDLEQYLSSGTIKGIVMFDKVIKILKEGGYLLVDELENHFNKEIVAIIVRFFLDSKLNSNGGTLIFTTHYPEILDEYNRNDSIYVLRNENGIEAEPISSIL